MVACTVGLLSCGNRDDGADQKPDSKEKPEALASKRAMSPKAKPQRASNPPPILRLQDNEQRGLAGLRHRGQAPLAMELRMPGGEDWQSANIGRAVVRQPDGSQMQIADESAWEALRAAPRGTPLRLRAAMPGVSMLIVSAGPSGQARGRWAMRNNRYFTKVIFSQLDHRGEVPGPDPGILQKTGQPLEIRPVISPLGLDLSQESQQMAVKIYDDQKSKAFAEVEVFAPSGEAQRIRAEKDGTAYFEVREPGVYRLRYESQIEWEPAAAELIFAVPGDTDAQNKAKEGGQH